ncbi:MAG: hypothetical protein V1909_04460 [Candidatus Micrarchaeota archaeon]
MASRWAGTARAYTANVTNQSTEPIVLAREITNIGERLLKLNGKLSDEERRMLNHAARIRDGHGLTSFTRINSEISTLTAYKTRLLELERASKQSKQDFRKPPETGGLL